MLMLKWIHCDVRHRGHCKIRDCTIPRPQISSDTIAVTFSMYTNLYEYFTLHNYVCYYFSLESCRLSRGELWKLTRGGVVLLAAFMQGAFFMSCDLGLYWVLDMVRKHGHWKAGLDRPGDVKIYVQGDGILANIYQ